MKARTMRFLLTLAAVSPLLLLVEPAPLGAEQRLYPSRRTSKRSSAQLLTVDVHFLDLVRAEIDPTVGTQRFSRHMLDTTDRRQLAAELHRTDESTTTNLVNIFLVGNSDVL